MNTGPMAFMRGITFREASSRSSKVRASICAIRASRTTPAGAAVRSESRAFLAPWEPVWASDELTKSAFRRRIKRYQKETRADTAYAFFVFRKDDDTR